MSQVRSKLVRFTVGEKNSRFLGEVGPVGVAEHGQGVGGGRDQPTMSLAASCFLAWSS